MGADGSPTALDIFTHFPPTAVISQDEHALACSSALLAAVVQ